MESMRKKWNDLPLRSFFTGTIFTAIGLVAALSLLIIWGCVSFRHYLLPDPDGIYLTVQETYANGTVMTSQHLLSYDEPLQELPTIVAEEDGSLITDAKPEVRYSIQKLEQSVAMLTPKRRLAYEACGIIMAAAPAVLSFTAIFLCSTYFYRRKLEQPLRLLSGATREIAQQNLDFSIDYDCKDELGALCRSFDQMRTTLLENNKAMWKMLEERRLLQTAVAHDLRNPIAIIQGYTEYLESGLEKNTIDRIKASRIARNLNLAARRLKHYTESVRTLNHWETVEPSRSETSLPALAAEIGADFELLCSQNGLSFLMTANLPDVSIQVDSALLYRILENLVGNALRYAKKTIRLEFRLQDSSSSGHILRITIADDGEGFPPEILKHREKSFSIHGKDGHMGIGLAVSTLLCQKHGGTLELSASPEGGAEATITISV